MKPKDFIISTDWATLKNDTQSNTISLTVSAGTIYSPSNPILGQVSMEVGQINAGIRARARTTKFPNWVVGSSILSTSMTTIPSMPAVPAFEQWLLGTLERTSPTTVTLTVASEGGTGVPDLRVQETQTITFVFSTFLSPFN